MCPPAARDLLSVGTGKNVVFSSPLLQIFLHFEASDHGISLNLTRFRRKGVRNRGMVAGGDGSATGKL